LNVLKVSKEEGEPRGISEAVNVVVSPEGANSIMI
jgi:hypothetical protein